MSASDNTSTYFPPLSSLSSALSTSPTASTTTSALSTSTSPTNSRPASPKSEAADKIIRQRLARTALTPLSNSRRPSISSINNMPIPDHIEVQSPRRLSIPASERVAFVPPSQPVTPAKQLPTSVPLPVLPAVEAAKRLAAFAAVDRHINLDHKVIGIGSGSTVPYVVDRIVAQGKEANVKRVFIPTGFQSKELIIKAGLTLGDVDQYPHLDVTIDGADEVDGDLNSIKGGGACQLREKVLAEAADTWVIVADYRKNSKVLGTNWTQGIPIEVVPFAYAKVLTNLQQLGSPERLPNGKPGLALRMGVKKAGPVVSDNGNFIIDAPFPRHEMEKPVDLLYKIKMITGVVEVGLFCNMARAAYFGNEDGTVSIKNEDGSRESIDSVPDVPEIALPGPSKLAQLKQEELAMSK